MTEETKLQPPHWKSEDITDRNISRKDIEDRDTTSRHKITRHIFPNNNETDVMRVDIANTYGDKNTVDHTEESKSTVDWSEE